MKLRAKITENRAKTVPKRSQNEARTPKGAQLGPGARFGPILHQIWSYFGMLFGSIYDVFGDRFSDTFSASFLGGFGLTLGGHFGDFFVPGGARGVKSRFFGNH